MKTYAIRGAITADENTPRAIKEASLELFNTIITENNLKESDVIYVEFSTTSDLNTAYPAKFIRLELEWKNTAFMCLQEMHVKESLPMCIRVLIVCNKNEDFKPKFIYLKNARNLRSKN